MFTTYVIVNNQGKKYTGSTSDISERLSMHNNIEPCKAKFHRTTYKKDLGRLFFPRTFLQEKRHYHLRNF